MYKVFINEKVIFFTNNNDVINEVESGLFIHFFDTTIINFICDLLINDSKQECVVIKVENVEAAFQEFCSNFRLIRAAGGKVINDNGEILFIFRLGKWDLPKGKIEKGETTEQAAIREVEEECGVKKLEITKKLVDTYHIYSLNDELVLKKSTWFEMHTNDTSKLIPQLEENITEVKWIPKELIKEKVFINTYASIKEVFE